eukprot:24915-Amphidinium_carterae.2
MKRRAEQDDKPSKLAPVELNERLDRIRQKLGGLHWGSSLEPSHALVNKFCQMHEEGVLKYIAWEQLTSRSHEAQGLQRDVGTRLIVTDSSGHLRFRTVDNKLSIPLGSDLKIEQALLRRGIAMDMACLLSFETHNLLVARFTDDIVRDPIEGFSKISWLQVQRADQELFRLLSDRTLGKLSDPHTAYACDGAFRSLLESPEFVRHLLSLPAAAPARASAPVKRELSSPPAPFQKRQKGKGKGKPRGLPLPAALLERGAVLSKTPSNERICYSFNLDKCSETGNACKNGRHACMKCGKEGHSLSFHQ